MADRIIIDSGPCIALFDRDDAFHEAALRFMQSYSGALYSNLAVVTEVMYVLDFSLRSQRGFLTWVQAGALNLVELIEDDFGRVSELMRKYADLPMDFTDATLVALADRLSIRRIASVDAHFDLYRFRRRSKFINVFSDTT